MIQPKLILAHPDHWQTGRYDKIDTIVLHIMAGTLSGTDSWFSASCAQRTAMNILGHEWFNMNQIQRDEYVADLIREKKVTAPPSSAHYGIGPLGEVHQYVMEKDSAYHAGVKPGIVPTWALYSNKKSMNSRSVGIEHEGAPDAHGNMSKFMPEAMLVASAALVGDIAKRYAIPLDRDHVIGHREIDPVNRKFCPPLDFPMDEIILRAKAHAAEGVS